MRTGMRKFIFWAVLWNGGALSLFFCGLVGATNIRYATGSASTELFWWLCALSVIGIAGMYAYFTPAEQISWTRAEFYALERYNEAWSFVGFIFFITTIVSGVARFANTLPPPFFYTLWQGCASVLLLAPSHILEVWRIGNLEEYERGALLTRARYKQ